MARGADVDSDVFLSFDPPGGAKLVGHAIEEALRGSRGPRWAVVAYVTSDEVGVLRKRTGRGNRPVLVCDPYQGNCDPGLLLRLRNHVQVYCRAGIHAKVYRGPSGVAVGSANLSSPALEPRGRLLEAMAVVRHAGIMRQADAWLKRVVQAPGTESLADLVKDNAVWTVIEAAYAAKQGLAIRERNRGRKRRRKRPPVRLPEFASVVVDPAKVGNLAFDFVQTKQTDVTRREARAIAQESGVELDEGWDFTEELSDDPSASIRESRPWIGSEVVTLRGKTRRAAGAFRPLSLDSVEAPWRLVAVRPARGRRVLYFYEPCLQRFRFTTSSTKRLVKRLDAALRSRALHQRPAVDRLVPSSVIADLLTQPSRSLVHGRRE